MSSRSHVTLGTQTGLTWTSDASNSEAAARQRRHLAGRPVPLPLSRRQTWPRTAAPDPVSVPGLRASGPPGGHASAQQGPPFPRSRVTHGSSPGVT